jgi:hypothetical protein
MQLGTVKTAAPKMLIAFAKKFFPLTPSPPLSYPLSPPRGERVRVRGAQQKLLAEFNPNLNPVISLNSLPLEGGGLEWG